MPFNTRYVFTASMDVEPDKEAIFNDVYDNEHVPCLLKVPGVVAVTRTVNEVFSVAIGGEAKEVVTEGEPKHHAMYEIESPEVLTSKAWADAVEEGRWPTEVRPYTSNRRHTLKRVTG
jgi:hypothetical protein